MKGSGIIGRQSLVRNIFVVSAEVSTDRPEPVPYQLIYHDIDEEIPEASRPLIKRLYQLWLVLGASLVVNMIACIFFVLSNQEDAGKDLGTSISYVVLQFQAVSVAQVFIGTSSSSESSHSCFGTGEPAPLPSFYLNLTSMKTHLQWLHEGMCL